MRCWEIAKTISPILRYSAGGVDDSEYSISNVFNNVVLTPILSRSFVMAITSLQFYLTRGSAKGSMVSGISVV